MTGGIRYNRATACIRTVGCAWQTVSAQAAAVRDNHVRGPSADCLSGSAHLTSPPWRSPAASWRVRLQTRTRRLPFVVKTTSEAFLLHLLVFGFCGDPAALYVRSVSRRVRGFEAANTLS